MKNNRKLGKVLVILGCCCVIAAAALYGYNTWISYRAAMASSKLTHSVDALLKKSASSGSDVKEDSLLNDSDTESAEKSALSMDVNGCEVVGTISLPTIDIELAVLSNWSYVNLNISACRYSGTPDRQLILLAHDYDSHFGLIYKLKTGDPVRFVDVNGKVYNYKVTGSEIKGKYQLQEIVSGDWDLTLFTCTYGGQNRVVVRCKRTN